MKNLFYNISDILLALIIVAVCAGVIYWRMTIIMDYPEQMAAKAHKNEVEQVSKDSEADAAEAPAETEQEAVAEAPAA